eukprot:CAMPEP_0180040652 /NCGR_PEP_ID=MMETSP0984-20121128/33607_1 /TAXON_ID=483367 /ORGANISM="non described non described, Strain CCMP 2436" /LENGTH=686 /DNA_ID=CAMNT_0021967973 /DNA_START=102 /DNA_END=2163 /DNA_ORIENTATION=-
MTCSDACSDGSLDQCIIGCATPLELLLADRLCRAVHPDLLSALASGLTLGLMSLDTTGLQIIVAGGQEPECTRAGKILPLRKRGNQLLCTLLLTNTLVNARLSIFLGSITSGVVGGLVATALIVIFGEIIPQATCSRHALLIGSIMVEPMRLLILLLTPVCWPISKVLDKVLGDEITSGHTKREIEHLLRTQHTEDPNRSGGNHERDVGRMTMMEQKLLGGVLALSEKTAQDVMTDFDNIFMIDYSAKLDFRSLREIYRSGYTRVPVYDKTRNNLVGVLNTKDLVLVDADDELPVSEIMGACGRPIFTVSHSTPLDKMLNTFKASRTHLALVQRIPEPGAEGPSEPGGPSDPASSTRLDHPLGSAHRVAPLAPALAGAVGLDVTPSPMGVNMAEPIVLASSGSMLNIVGIVTLEDVLEELLQAEIVDENDCVEDNVTLKPFEGKLKEMADRRFAFLDMLQHQPRSSMMTTSLGSGLATDIRMTHTELAAVCSFLSGNSAHFSGGVLSQEMLLTLIMQCKVCDVLPGTPAALICKRGSPCQVAFLVLQGRVRVIAGAEGFKTEFGPWTLLAAKSFEREDYCPDFTATVVEHARLLLISSAGYRLLAGAASDMRLASEMINIGRDEPQDVMPRDDSSDSDDNLRVNKLQSRKSISATRQSSGSGLRGNTPRGTEDRSVFQNLMDGGLL